jgi:hypothetical protein
MVGFWRCKNYIQFWSGCEGGLPAVKYSRGGGGPTCRVQAPAAVHEPTFPFDALGIDVSSPPLPNALNNCVGSKIIVLSIKKSPAWGAMDGKKKKNTPSYQTKPTTPNPIPPPQSRMSGRGVGPHRRRRWTRTPESGACVSSYLSLPPIPSLPQFPLFPFLPNQAPGSVHICAWFRSVPRRKIRSLLSGSRLLLLPGKK